MTDVIIRRVENGYIIQQQHKDYNWKNSWVAESMESLLKIIENCCKLTDNTEGGQE